MAAVLARVDGNSEQGMLRECPRQIFENLHPVFFFGLCDDDDFFVFSPPFLVRRCFSPSLRLRELRRPLSSTFFPAASGFPIRRVTIVIFLSRMKLAVVEVLHMCLSIFALSHRFPG